MNDSKFKQIVLVGGGHTHALVIKMWGMQPMAGVQLVLVSPSWRTPYSGMLPGLLAGHYSEADMHIDLRVLCRWANVRFIEGSATGVQPELQRLQLQSREPVEYDLLSFDIGATPDTSILGMKEFAHTVKPISRFYQRFERLLTRCRQQGSTSNTQAVNVAVVGGGAGGVEVVLALAERLNQEGLSANIRLLVRADSILTGYPAAVVKAAQQTCGRYNIEIVPSFDVTEVLADGVVASTGQTLALDEVFFCTQVKAASWLQKSGLSCDEKGFIEVNASLQSVSSPTIFAAGDIAAMVDTPRAKAGVFAVRQAPTLLENLQRALLSQPLKAFSPQTNFLSLLSLGAQNAVASRGSLSVAMAPLQGYLWRRKDRIDRRFMAMFQDLPALDMAAPKPVAAALLDDEERDVIINPEMRCAGCGGKVGSTILQSVLEAVTGQKEFAPEDAATVQLQSTTLIQSVDQIKAPIDDPYVFGRIATLHALSDAYAMAAIPTSTQLLLNLPYAGEEQQRREMTELMRGISEELSENNCTMLGGHTAEGRDLSVGLVVNAEPVSSAQKNIALSTKAGLEAGDTLVLTKPLGVGVILAAHMPASPVQAQGDWVSAAVANMLISNKHASEIFSDLGISACTDVTGFGLVGHLAEMLRAASVAAELNLSSIPLLPGALALSTRGVKSSLYSQNIKALNALSISEKIAKDPRFKLLFDPQTSGGLLAGVKPNQLQQLRDSDLEFWEIGCVQASDQQNDWDLVIYNGEMHDENS